MSRAVTMRGASDEAGERRAEGAGDVGVELARGTRPRTS